MRARNLTLLVALLLALPLQAAKFIGIKVLDKDYIVLQFRDGEVRYRDTGKGRSAFLGHTFIDGDDTLKTFLPRFNTATSAVEWFISSQDDKHHNKVIAIYRKSKPMNTDHTLTSELDHWVFLKLESPMKQGCTYTVSIPSRSGSDKASAEIKYDIWNSQSESIHVNILGYSTQEKTKSADLYYWLGDGGPRDYKSFEGKKVWLYNVKSGSKQQVGKVKFWKKASDCTKEAGSKNLTGSDVWNLDFSTAAQGTYRLVVDGVGCSMDFVIKPDLYLEPYKYSVLGYYYMRLGEPVQNGLTPRQPMFLPEENPNGFTVYKTDLHPWHPDWRKLRGDVWDEPHFKNLRQSAFWKHRLPGNPVNTEVRGGHSDAMDWDRHLAHVSNIYDMLLPYILSGGRLSEDNLGIRESGNGIPDLIDEARNEVDFFLSIRDGEAYSQGVTNPDRNWSVMFQAGCTTMAAWANAANCAIIGYAFRLAGNNELENYYKDEAVKAFNFASKQENQQLDDMQGIGLEAMRGRDFKQMAAAFLYNLTGDTQWEDIAEEESVIKGAEDDRILLRGRSGHCQIWGVAAYLTCPWDRHFPVLYNNMVKALTKEVKEDHLSPSLERPSRRAADDARWMTSENLQRAIMLHYCTKDKALKQQLETAMYTEASWCLGRNPGNIVEMTGLGQRHITDCYSTGRNDGLPGTHPGQTPFNGTETWSQGDGGDARIILRYCYPDWWSGGWPRQESYFNQRYFWVNGEFTPRETMRGKLALVAYLYGIRP